MATLKEEHTTAILTVFANRFSQNQNIRLLCSKDFQYLQCLDKPLRKGFFHSESHTIFWETALQGQIGRTKKFCGKTKFTDVFSCCDKEVF